MQKNLVTCWQMKIFVVVARSWPATAPSAFNGRSSVPKGLKMSNWRHIQFSNSAKFRCVSETLVLEELSALCFDIQVGIPQSPAPKRTAQRESLENAFSLCRMKDMLMVLMWIQLQNVIGTKYHKSSRFLLPKPHGNWNYFPDIFPIL